MNKSEKKNAKQFPCIYYAKHMETGLAGYEDETILVDTDNLKDMIASFVGKPVYVNHQEVDLNNLKETSHGYVVESFYNEVDGWFWVKMILVDDVAMEAVADGWSVSNAYIPTEWGGGGTHHNCPYDRKIVNGEFTHLAIVPNPRYEEAGIFSPAEFKAYNEQKRKKLDELKNSKDQPTKGKTMFKMFKNTKEEVKEIDGDTMIEITNDNGEKSDVKIQDMIKALENAKKNEAEAAKKEESEKANMDTMVTVGDEELSVKELMNRYKKLNKKNSDDEDEGEKSNTDDEDEDDSAKENEADEDEKEEKKNAKSDHFKELSNAKKDKKEVVNSIDLGLNSTARGKARYGSAK